MRKIEKINEKWAEAFRKEVSDIKAPILIENIKAQFKAEALNKKEKRSFFQLPVLRLLSFVMVFALAFIIIGIILPNPSYEEPNVFDTPTPDSTQQQQLIAFQSTTAISLVDNSSQTTLSSSENSSEFLYLATEDPLEDQLPLVNPYMSIVEQLLYQNSPITVEVITDEADLKDGYQYQLLIKNQSVFGVNYEYKLYYNETPVEENGTDLTYQSTELTGLIIDDTTTYQFIGNKEISFDTNGKIKDIELETSLSLNQENWVKVGRSEQNGTIEYSYEVMKNGAKTNTKLQRSLKNKEIIVNFEAQVNNSNLKFNFKPGKENNKPIILLSNENNQNVSISLEEVEGKRFLHYKWNGNEKSLEKPNHGYGKKGEGNNDDGNTSGGGNEPGGNEPGGNEPGGNEPGGNEPGGNEPGGGNNPGGNTGGGFNGGDESNSGDQNGSNDEGGQQGHKGNNSLDDERRYF